MQKIAWLTDQHFPFEDRRAWQLALRIAADFRPDAVPIGSDDRDFYAISSFDKDPLLAKSMLEDTRYWFARMDELKDALEPGWREGTQRKRVFYPTILGNHNMRWIKYLWQHPEIYGIPELDYPNLHKYAHYGFNWNGNAQDWDQNTEWRASNQLTITHGNRLSVNAQMASRYYDTSILIGHLHRFNKVTFTRPDRSQVVGVQSYCLCQLEPKWIEHPNWQHGLTLVTVYDDYVNFEDVPFVHASGRVHAIWRDKYYVEQ